MKLDANDILAMVGTWQQGDISDNPLYQGDFHHALGAIKAQAIIMPSQTDQYFPPADSDEFTVLDWETADGEERFIYVCHCCLAKYG